MGKLPGSCEEFGAQSPLLVLPILPVTHMQVGIIIGFVSTSLQGSAAPTPPIIAITTTRRDWPRMLSRLTPLAPGTAGTPLATPVGEVVHAWQMPSAFFKHVRFEGKHP